MIVEVEGVVEHVGEIENIEYGEGKTFRKKTVIIKTDEKIKPLFAVEFTNDDCDKEVEIGDKITAECYLNGSDKLWNGKAFLSLTLRELSIKGKQDQAAEPSDEVPF